MVNKRKAKHALFAIASLAMLFYGLPRIELGEGFTLQNVFGAIWVGFAMMVAAAHLHMLFNVSEETSRHLTSVKRKKYAMWQQTIERRFNR
ncbi:hypothetical protein DNH61_17720 [Paenibacillus sambharensis]|uniref:Uncharacterized protein n=1 Tax=Paenibacillus sambharensis TaxID=1803190 RepID=A0A2W1LI94_9BACL|nr:hypothetical protein [Paenibacillus sambharensis]PZD94254.1 hypothetical protein DNH61_17720 [Paenibacillus sambharensis]